MGRKILKLLDVMCVGACMHLKDKERESASAERERHMLCGRVDLCGRDCPRERKSKSRDEQKEQSTLNKTHQ